MEKPHSRHRWRALAASKCMITADSSAEPGSTLLAHRLKSLSHQTPSPMSYNSMMSETKLRQLRSRRIVKKLDVHHLVFPAIQREYTDTVQEVPDTSSLSTRFSGVQGPMRVLVGGRTSCGSQVQASSGPTPIPGESQVTSPAWPRHDTGGPTYPDAWRFLCRPPGDRGGFESNERMAGSALLVGASRR
jgi:hypothetical protein